MSRWIEACSSSHYWARELTARGHEVRLMPAQYVKPYVKRGKNDAADAEAICEAVTRPTMRFVPVKSPEQQSVMMLHRVRLMLNRQRTQLSNSIRAHLSEFGIVASIGRRGLDQLLAIVADEEDTRVPAHARLCLQMLAAQLAVVKQQILENDRRVLATSPPGLAWFPNRTQAEGRNGLAVSQKRETAISGRCLWLGPWR